MNIDDILQECEEIEEKDNNRICENDVVRELLKRNILQEIEEDEK